MIELEYAAAFHKFLLSTPTDGSNVDLLCGVISGQTFRAKTVDGNYGMFTDSLPAPHVLFSRAPCICGLGNPYFIWLERAFDFFLHSDTDSEDWKKLCSTSIHVAEISSGCPVPPHSQYFENAWLTWPKEKCQRAQSCLQVGDPVAAMGFVPWNKFVTIYAFLYALHRWSERPL